MQTLKAIAVMLHYPDETLQRHAGELVDMVGAERRLSSVTRRQLIDLIRHWQSEDLLDLQAAYVGLFDRSRALSLHLFEHVHGESRDRGQAMVDLQDIYRKQGLDIAANELPDYVPLFLEFCSRLPEQDAREWLQEVAHLLLLLHGRLQQRESSYAALFQALLELGEVAEPDADFRRQLSEEERDDTPEALDRVWAEEPVIFGPTDGCGGARTNTGQAVPVEWTDRRKTVTEES
ncbi:nitrate reductase delta subunit [Natronocella acetinitrilica]|jgi:nitrate reductase molybdenum cofactor assembly chaperone NarJ/NarW|uniref:Nitrate reductase delta subunit n=1 Tax=Natronocella acetinitrilica TaxID=414046 RepID=A0AAE3KAK8_9GAMM|nr:nitrate reductase molybdenum cofactor assembly chaperone [Natronocella acetinitrilica]MCP1673536.1 nitrate reductase delta subunit [Natronocella acetinitrilica]